MGVLLLFNTVGLVFVGLEHSLQVLLTLLAVLQLFDVARGGRPRAWLWLVLVLGPLVRYENLALTLPALSFLWFMGHRRAAMVTLASLTGLLVAFSMFLLGQGLPPLPSSVLAKLGTDAGGGTPVPIPERLVKNLLHTWSGPWLLLLAAALFAGARSCGERGLRGFAVVILIAIFGHSALGSFGWFHRYEIYVLAAAVTAAGLMHRERTRNLFRVVPKRASAIALVVLAVACGKSFYISAVTPFATHELYRQQYVMGRIAREAVQAPVAVNDLGLVAFRNPHFVVDLWGLGSPTALKARMRNGDMAWADTLCRRHGVRIVMIYAPWFPSLPASWKCVGALRLDVTPDVPGASVLATLVRFAHRHRGTVVVASEQVLLFAVQPGDERRVRESLARFRPQLAKGVEIVLE